MFTPPSDFKPDFSKGNGLIAAIAQDFETSEVLMLAWMNEESWRLTLESGEAYYWSRSRQKLWHKGESSGNTQIVREILMDCDSDAIILKIKQIGEAACHTGRRSCFYRKLLPESADYEFCSPQVFDPEKVYH